MRFMQRIRLNQLFSLFLALAMLFSCLPSGSFPVGGFGEAYAEELSLEEEPALQEEPKEEIAEEEPEEPSGEEEEPPEEEEKEAGEEENPPVTPEEVTPDADTPEEITPDPQSPNENAPDAGMPEGDAPQNSVILPEPVPVEESGNTPAFSAVLVRFTCEQAEDLSALQVRDAQGETVDPLFDETASETLFGRYSLAPGSYTYSFSDESGTYEALSDVAFTVSGEEEEMMVPLTLTAVQEETQEEETPTGPVTLDGKPVEESITSGLALLNPLFPHSEEDYLLAEAAVADNQMLRGNRLMAALKPGEGQTIFSEDIATTYTTLSIDTEECVPYEQAVTAIRAAMVRRDASIELAYHSGSTKLSTIAELSALFDDVAVHTGNPQEGDYIRYHYRTLNITNRLSIKYQDTWYHKYTMNFAYYSSAEQEAAVGSEIASVLAGLNLSDENKTDYDRVLAIYKYIVGRVTYQNDYAAREKNGIFTHYAAYGALIEKKSVCQGYANLFYRMCLTLGIGARIIAGNSGGTPHAWNIVKVGNAWYPVDATWDAYYSDGTLRYFLTRNEHDNCMVASGSALYASYNVPTTDYPCNKNRSNHVFDPAVAPQHTFTVTDGKDVCQVCGVSKKHVHSFPDGCETQEKAATCTEAGYLKKKCAGCGQFIDTEDRPALGHDPVDMSATDTTAGGKICSRCRTILQAPDGKAVVSIPEVQVSQQVYINGVAYSAAADGLVVLPASESECTSAVTYSYAEGTGGAYPTGMKVWLLDQDDTTGVVTADRADYFDDLLIYSGTSIRLKGDQGIAIHTNLNTATWNLLLSGNYHGYRVEEAGLLVSREEKNPAPTYGGANVTAAPSYQRTGSIKSINVNGNTSYYMNTLVFGSNMECTKWKLACRPYIKLISPDGDIVFLYGGILVRSVQSVARQIQGKYSNNASVSAFIQKILDVA